MSHLSMNLCFIATSHNNTRIIPLTNNSRFPLGRVTVFQWPYRNKTVNNVRYNESLVKNSRASSGSGVFAQF